MAESKSHYVYGMHAVQAVLEREPELVSRVWIENSRRDAKAKKLLQLAHDANIKPERVKTDVLNKLVGENANHQGVIALSKDVPAGNEKDLKQLIDNLDIPPFLLILDGVQDPHNLGACLRTADAAGVHAVIAPKDKASGLTAVVRKVACGAAETVPFIQVTNLARTMRDLQQTGIWMIGTSLDTEQDIYQADLSGPLALVLGAEGKGLRRLTAENCDALVKLPMLGTVQSLNVSVSAGVCLYEAVRQRLPKNN
ncbi:MAG: 23S rRNA (guanosine(2251)-2'-O)-methyltransferase RlmB [Gammaproteobacteria bacterium]|nr:23S rRNA (guanosine(2251)-2'-O)-methyltransferase RlmB [Gammaproteobacteria bacterium]